MTEELKELLDSVEPPTETTDSQPLAQSDTNETMQTDAPAPKNSEIVLVLQKESLDFSNLLQKKEYTDYLQSVCAIDYGLYFPTSVATPLMPLPPLGLTTPMQREDIELSYREQRNARKEEEIKTIEQQETGFMGKVKKAMVKINSALDDVSSGLNEESTKTFTRVPFIRFRELLLPVNEKLIYDFHCSAVTGDSVATGYMFVTSNFLVFDGSKKDIPPPERGAGPGRRPEVIRITVPFAHIVSFHRGMKKYVPNSKHPVFVCTGKGQEEDSNSVLVYTDDGKLHVFYDFVHLMQSSYIDFLSVLDYTWRDLERLSRFEKDKGEKPMDVEKEPTEEKQAKPQIDEKPMDVEKEPTEEKQAKPQIDEKDLLDD